MCTIRLSGASSEGDIADPRFDAVPTLHYDGSFIRGRTLACGVGCAILHAEIDRSILM